MRPVSLLIPLVLALGLALLPPVAGLPEVAAQDDSDDTDEGRYRDFGDAGGFWSIVPPGQHGVVSVAEAPAAQAGSFPDHFNDQTPLYDGLLRAAGLRSSGPHPPGIDNAQIPDFFKDGSFGVEEVGESYSPTDDVTVVRDAEFGVPHIFGETREGAMFAAGYTVAEDRLFLMDILRHLGRGRLTELLGASPGNRAMDKEQLAVAPYTEEELTEQLADICDEGPEGERGCADLAAYTEGVNAYIAEARTDPTKLPAEYPALQAEPEDWVEEDTVAIASLVGGIFGKGGGNEVAGGEFLSQLIDEHGEDEGREIWADFRSANDPEAPHTTDVSFDYNNHAPEDIDDDSTALIDVGSYRATVEDDDGGNGDGNGLPLPGLDDLLDDGLLAAAQADVDDALVADGPFGPIELGSRDEAGASNALLVANEHTAEDSPATVFGPQTGYFTPQLLFEMSIHAPGISARGTAFAGTNIYVQLGRGADYAWSATSASADNVDQWILELCDPDGGEVDPDSRHYVYDGDCVEMDVVEHTYFAKPTAAGVCEAPDPECILISDEVERAPHYGPVIGRATVEGEPVAVAVQRSTYGAELASAVGFQRINDPDFMTEGADSFNEAFDGVDYTFNWFYTDGDDIAYKHSCLCPIRDERTDPDLPTWGTGEWDWTGDYLTPAEQPQVVNPDDGYILSWNNKQAPEFRAHDGQYNYSSTYRSEFLRTRIEPALARGPLEASDVVNIVQDAATADLNAQEIYPLVLEILDSGGGAPPEGADERVGDMRDRLFPWIDAGGHRRDVDEEGTYDFAVAVAIGDAALRPILDAVFGDEIGEADLPQGIENHPRLGQGSAYNGGQANFLHKDLRQVLGRDVEGERSRTYCGGGDLDTCRADLWQALEEAAELLESEPDDDDSCSHPDAYRFGSADVDDWIYDARCDDIVQAAAGVFAAPDMPWQNRPTHQQVVQVGVEFAAPDVPEIPFPCDDPPPAVYTDRTEISDAHLDSVDCATARDIVEGFDDGSYRPAESVRRDQMASFIAQTIDTAEGAQALPEAGEGEGFDDTEGNTHEDNIRRLQAAGIIGGTGDGDYSPAEPVRRDQMATFVLRGAEYAAGLELGSLDAPGADFGDVSDDNPHAGTIGGAAEQGLLRGRADGTYGPGEPTRRDQMATFVVNVLGAVEGETLDS